ncbi:ribosome-recycling factor, mitochondrial isoform X1 [Octopus sinensis]|uniref:Ribosome-recycling factor, mitochondrial n=2 Tax=Octopus sinensis TaxID=2607531 RepID=A0A7E6FLW3_9MOLL|nr:ribosome-recycling factor, mitochondrial isoform X1 [Octopus sinensis]
MGTPNTLVRRAANVDKNFAIMNTWRVLWRLQTGLFSKVQPAFIQKFPSTLTSFNNRRQMLCMLSKCHGNIDPRSSVSLTASYNWCHIREYAKASKSKKKTTGKPKVFVSDDQMEEVINLTAFKSEMSSVLEQLQLDYLNQLSLRVSTRVFDTITVKIENKEFRLNQIAQIIQKNPSLIVINLRESTQYLPIVKNAIIKSGAAINPQVDGTTIFIPIPKVSKEHREKLCKSAKTFCDKSKQKLREICNRYTKKLKASKGAFSEDLIINIQESLIHQMQGKMTEAEEMMARKQKDLLGDQK